MGKLMIEANRELKVCVPFSMDFLNLVRDIVQKNALDAKISTRYKFSDLDAIHAELIRMALEDSKAKATYIAEAMGQKVVGIKTMSVGNVRGKNMIPRPSVLGRCNGEHTYYDELLSMLSRRVQAPLSTETDSVEVVWLIE